MNADKLRTILVNHSKWVLGDGGERADLIGADLRNTNLRGADLRDADLCDANLSNADLSNADLYGANLSDANLRKADLSDANLFGANLSGADLRGANLSDICASESTAGYWLACPESGAFDAYKKCRDGVIVKLRIPASAKRSSATTRKCRASSAKVLAVYGAEYGVSQHDVSFIYRVGETVSVPDFDTDRWNECSQGIHFFITRSEAEQY